MALPLFACVTLTMIESPTTTVAVGVRLAPPSDGRSMFRYKFERPPSLQADSECIARFGNKEKHLLSCLGSTFTGVAKLQSLRPSEGIWLVTSLEGTNLRSDSGI